MSADNVMITSFNRQRDGFNGFGESVQDEQFASPRVGGPFQEHSAQGAANSAAGTVERDPFEFDFSSLLRLRSFVYLLLGTGVFLLQTHNTLSIINLARENELLREQIQMTTSVITSQDLKVDELHSIRNISQTAEVLDLKPSSIPSIKLDP